MHFEFLQRDLGGGSLGSTAEMDADSIFAQPAQPGIDRKIESPQTLLRIDLVVAVPTRGGLRLRREDLWIFPLRVANQQRHDGRVEGDFNAILGRGAEQHRSEENLFHAQRAE